MFNPDHIKKLVPVLAVVLLVIAVACSRGEGPGDGGGGGNGGPHVITDQDSIAPVVTINTPTANQVFTSGSSISMTGRITDETGLYQGNVKLINTTTGEVVKDQAYAIHGFRSYDYTVTFAPVVTSGSDFTVLVTFIDHGLNSASQAVKIRVNP